MSLSILTERAVPAEIEAALPIENSRWPITRELGRVLARLVIERGVRSVLEFGAGSSSVVLGTALAMVGGGRLTSIEHRPQFSADAWKRVRAMPTVDAELIVAPLRPCVDAAGLGVRYHAPVEQLVRRGPFDLIVIDAPPFYYGREGALHISYPHLSQGALIVLDDAGRAEEQRAIRRWLQRYPGLQLLEADDRFGNNGAAVLIANQLMPPRNRWQSAVGASIDQIWALRHVRHHAREIGLSLRQPPAHTAK